MAKLSNLDLLSEVGRTVFGERWRRSMSGALGYTERTLGRWLAGEAEVPDYLHDGTSLYNALLAILEEHKKDVASTERSVKKAIADSEIAECDAD